MPVTRLLPVALRVGAIAAATWTAWNLGRSLRAGSHAGRVDQRAEDALDALEEGVAFHRSAVLGDTGENRQTNASARFRRTVRLGERTIEIDASGLARLRLRRV